MKDKGKFRRGASLLEMLVFVGIVVGVVVAGLALLGNGYRSASAGRVRERASSDARAYAADLYPGWTVVRCQPTDSDGDGYVTCSVGDGAGHVEGVECRASLWLDYARGCRPMRAMPRPLGR